LPIPSIPSPDAGTPDIFCVALNNNRIVGVQDDRVTFRYRDGDTKQLRTCTLPALSFMGRFLQHVLPKGFVKVRYYGLFSHRQQALLAQVRQQLLRTEPRAASARATKVARADAARQKRSYAVRCVASRCSTPCCDRHAAAAHRHGWRGGTGSRGADQPRAGALGRRVSPAPTVAQRAAMRLPTRPRVLVMTHCQVTPTRCGRSARGRPTDVLPDRPTKT